MKFLRGLLAYVLFFPTLAWNGVRWRLGRWHKWDRIDDHVIVSGLPWAKDVPAMCEAGVRGVINTCREYRGPQVAYSENGIEHLWLPTIDFRPPSIDDVEQGVRFVQKHADAGHSVLVHCKAGRGRSATIAICWLIARHNLTPEAAQAKLNAQRPHVLKNLYRRPVVQEFWRRHKSNDHE